MLPFPWFQHTIPHTPKLLTEILSTLGPCLLSIINLSLTSGYVPEDFKLVSVHFTSKQLLQLFPNCQIYLSTTIQIFHIHTVPYANILPWGHHLSGTVYPLLNQLQFIFLYIVHCLVDMFCCSVIISYAALCNMFSCFVTCNMVLKGATVYVCTLIA